MEDNLDYDVSDERKRAFLADLGALAIKHRIVVGGCGCCGSPYLYGVKKVGAYVFPTTDGNVDVEYETDPTVVNAIKPTEG